MNFSEQTISILDYICNKFGIAIDWTSDNVWPMVEMLAGKYIKWEIASSILWIILFFISIIICTIGIKLIIKHIKNSSYVDEMWVAFCVFISLGIFGLACGIAAQAFDIAKCIVFPELEIFEYLKETLNAMSK